MRGVGRSVLLLTLPVLLACWVATELVFRFVFPASESPFVATTPPGGCLRFDPKAKRAGVFTMGPLAEYRAQWRVNEAGWVSEIEYPLQKSKGRLRVAVIGDSYVEALQVGIERNLAAQLRRLEPRRLEVFSFGISGAPLSQYLALSREVAELYDPDVLVFVVVFNDFEESLTGSGEGFLFHQVEVNGCEVTERPSAGYRPRNWRHLLARSATVRWLFGIGRTAMARVVDVEAGPVQGNVRLAELGRKLGAIECATRYLIERLASENRGRRLIVVLDAPRPAIYATVLAVAPQLKRLQALMGKACLASGCTLVDMEGPFRTEYSRTGERFEFPGDGHWNEKGHRLVAEELRKAIASGAVGQSPVVVDEAHEPAGR